MAYVEGGNSFLHSFLILSQHSQKQRDLRRDEKRGIFILKNVCLAAKFGQDKHEGEGAGA